MKRAADVGNTFRAVTYNIHKGIGGVDRRYDLERVAATIARYRPDIVFLQEVAQGSARYDHDRQVDRLSERLGLPHWSFFVSVRFRTRGEYGNAILSRFPMRASSSLCLKLPGKKQRSVIHARLRARVGTRDRTLHAFNVHLGLAEFERRIQLRRFLASHPFARLDPRAPAILAGDFNDVWNSSQRLLAPAGFTARTPFPPTFPAFAPVRALDAIYVRGDLDCVGLTSSRLALARHASDHLPLVADFRFVRASKKHADPAVTNRNGPS